MKVKLSEVFELQIGKTPSRNNISYWNGNNKWISIADLSNANKYIYETKECITEAAVSDIGIKLVPKETIVMSFKLSIGKVAITQEDMYTNEAIMAFIDKGIFDIDINYIYYLFLGMDWLVGTNKAVMGLTLNKSVLSEKEIVLPDIKKQHEIVDKLTCLDFIITNKKKQLAKLDEIIKSRFIEMFGNININDRDWDALPLGDLCTIVRGGSPRPIVDYLGGTIPWIKIGDATEGDDIYLRSTKEFIISEGIKKSRMVKAGSLIFANCGVSLGFARIITFDGCIHDGWLAMEDIDGRLNKIFLLQSLNQMTGNFRKMAPAGTQPNLNTTIMKAYMQILPPIKLQEEFISFIENVNKSELAVKASLDKLETLKKSLMQQYFG